MIHSNLIIKKKKKKKTQNQQNLISNPNLIIFLNGNTRNFIKHWKKKLHPEEELVQQNKDSLQSKQRNNQIPKTCFANK